MNTNKVKIQPEYKRCSKCKNIKKVSEFYICKRNPDGYHYQCKICSYCYKKRGNMTEEERNKARKDSIEKLKRYKKSHPDYKERNLLAFRKWIDVPENRQKHNSKRIRPLCHKLTTFLKTLNSEANEEEIKGGGYYKSNTDIKVTKRLRKILNDHIKKMGYTEED